MIDTLPRWSCEFFPFSSARGPLSPAFRPLREPSPLRLATNSVLPSSETSTAPGYQAVGISPASRLSRGDGPSAADDPVPRRTTATQLLVPLATYSVPPPGLRARALQPLPKGSRPSGRQGMVSTTSSVSVRITDTVSLLALAT